MIHFICFSYFCQIQPILNHGLLFWGAVWENHILRAFISNKREPFGFRVSLKPRKSFSMEHFRREGILTLTLCLYFQFRSLFFKIHNYLKLPSMLFIIAHEYNPIVTKHRLIFFRKTVLYNVGCNNLFPHFIKPTCF